MSQLQHLLLATSLARVYVGTGKVRVCSCVVLLVTGEARVKELKPRPGTDGELAFLILDIIFTSSFILEQSLMIFAFGSPPHTSPSSPCNPPLTLPLSTTTTTSTRLHTCPCTSPLTPRLATPRQRFFHDPWNCLDLSLVVFSFMGLIAAGTSEIREVVVVVVVAVVVGFYYIHPKAHKVGQPLCDSLGDPRGDCGRGL